MSAVWSASRAAVRRRRLQTVVIGFVVLVSTATLVVALGLMTAASAPFDQALARQSGAHLAASFDPARATDAALAGTATGPGVEAAAGPFGATVLEVPDDHPDYPPRSFATVGRADPGGPVDRLDVWAGRWATAPGEIVLQQLRGETPYPVGSRLTPAGGPTLTVVGLASSVTRSADAWVTPAQLTALHPRSTQMLYRLTAHATDADLKAATATLTAALPAGSLLGSEPYFVVKNYAEGSSGMFVPFLTLFGVLGLVVAVLIVGNVVSGAVVAGLRQIGVMKAIGFAPGQVVAVFLVMSCVPGVVGCVLGTVLGHLVALPILAEAFSGFGGSGPGISPWVDVAALLGMPAVVTLAALLPALRARSLSATEAISAGSAPRTGRALRVQRWLSGTRLPRAASLGVGMAFARPGRSAMTLGAVVLGVLSVTVAVGFTLTLTDYSHAATRRGAYQVGVIVNHGSGPPGEAVSTLTDREAEALIRRQPGVTQLTAMAADEYRIAGQSEPVMVDFRRSDSPDAPWLVLKGKWLDGPGQIEANEDFLHKRGLRVGDSFVLSKGERSTRVVIAGEILATGMDRIYAGWDTLQLLAAAQPVDTYEVRLAAGTDTDQVITGIRAGDPGLHVFAETGTSQSSVVVMTGTTSLLSLLLGLVAALGIFNTVVLNTRERRRDLGMLKSIGMTPRQVVGMTVTSMATLGALGSLVGVPLGVISCRLLGSMTAEAAHAIIPPAMLDVFSAPLLLGLALSGVAIAVLGALVPAGSAARLTIAEVLHNE
ncbi:FtsX-like permease family protein [Kitasatospora sp. McL0602]|uniref:FtsX-like permease family protein n=1 Tax=Kitasatospora sp. McL0602 TaxID=3439530 RepID=UPI003F8870F0